jgi:RND family efflux transporter MFP subunit
MNGKTLKTAGWACVVLAAVVGFNGCKKKTEEVKMPPPKVTVAKPSQRDVTVYKKYPGQLRAQEMVAIEARISGFLLSVNFEDGDMVQKGQKLFEIEDVAYKATVEKAKADLAKAQAQEKVAKTSLDRMRNAYKTKAVSEIDVLVAEGDFDSAKANVLAAKARLEAAKLNLSYATVTAPVSGRISRHFVSVGNLVGPGSVTRLAELVTIDPMQLYFNVDERVMLSFVKKAGGVRGVVPKGDYPVKMELADGSIYEHDGYVDYVGNILDSATGTLPARAIFQNKKGQLISGMFGKVMIPQEYKQTILLPERAMQRDMVGSYFLAVNDKGVVEARYVEPGEPFGGERIIKKGIAPTDRIIIRGLSRARPGMQVEAQDATKAELDEACGLKTAPADKPAPATDSKAKADQENTTSGK